MNGRNHHDVVVVGSGAGGGIAAYVLAKAGADVLVLEKGPHLEKDAYGDDELKFGDRRFIDQDPLIEPRTFRDRPEQGDRLFVGRVLPVNRSVGGGSVHYGAVCFRFRPEDFAARETWGDLPGADVVNWPLSYEELRPYYANVERLIGVAGGRPRVAPPDGASGPNPPVAGAEWRDDPYPMPGHPPNYGAKLFEDAADRMGLHPFPTPVAINNGTYDGRPGCSYCGFCSSHGCPIDAKGDTNVTALRRAADPTNPEIRGRCTIEADANVVRVTMDGGEARGVEYLDREGDLQEASGDVVVLACSTVETPRLVLLSELPRDLVNHDVLGRYLMVHHFPGGIGFFDERIDYHRGFWSMRCLDDFYLGDPWTGQRMFGLGNLQTVGPSSGYPLFAGGLISTAKTVGWGRGHKDRVGRTFGHMQFLGLVGQDPPMRRNVVDLDPDVKDVYGLPVARITYAHHPNDQVVTDYILPQLEALLGAMGAETFRPFLPTAFSTSVPQTFEGDNQRGALRGAPDPIGGLVNHQMGTMRMGANPDTSVVDEWQRVHGVPNLYVADGSVFPTSGGYNPTLTIQALAWRAAEEIWRVHGKGKGERQGKGKA